MLSRYSPVVTFLIGLLSVACADAAWDYPTLQQMAREAFQNGEVQVAEPIIRVEGGVLSYYLGEAGYIFDPEGMDISPMDLPMRNQLKIEVIRKYRMRPKNRNFWEPVFARVGPLIAQQLAIAQATNLSKTQQLDKLAELEQKIGRTYDRAMHDHARQSGLRAAMIHPRTMEYEVTLAASPPGGKIYLIHTLANRIAKAAGKKPKWRPIKDPSLVPLQGKYWYKIEWPNRTVVGSKPIHINRNGKYVLK